MNVSFRLDVSRLATIILLFASLLYFLSSKDLRSSARLAFRRYKRFLKRRLISEYKSLKRGGESFLLSEKKPLHHQHFSLASEWSVCSFRSNNAPNKSFQSSLSPSLFLWQSYLSTPKTSALTYYSQRT